MIQAWDERRRVGQVWCRGVQAMLECHGICVRQECTCQLHEGGSARVRRQQAVRGKARYVATRWRR